jgi:ABC-type Zn uptake system ZnuABC Zn-binding protein ZnuA
LPSLRKGAVLSRSRGAARGRGEAAAWPAPPVLVLLVAELLLTLLAVLGCGGTPGESSTPGSLKVVATTTILRDLAQQVAGDRFQVTGLIPIGADPHEWQPTPTDMVAATESDLFIINGGNLETALVQSVKSANLKNHVVVAAAGLAPRSSKPGEPAVEQKGTVDAHWWLDPIDVITYVNNIRDAFARADPAGASTYEANAATYMQQLLGLDSWIREQVSGIPESQRLLVMDHLSHGYFADRYGFRVVGAVIPSVSTEAEASLRQLQDLVTTIETLHVKAIFVEVAESPKVAEQVAKEAHVKVVTNLLDHSLTNADGPAPDYISMMKYDTQLIVDNLK